MRATRSGSPGGGHRLWHANRPSVGNPAIQSDPLAVTQGLALHRGQANSNPGTSTTLATTQRQRPPVPLRAPLGPLSSDGNPEIRAAHATRPSVLPHDTRISPRSGVAVNEQVNGRHDHVHIPQLTVKELRRAAPAVKHDITAKQDAQLGQGCATSDSRGDSWARVAPPPTAGATGSGPVEGPQGGCAVSHSSRRQEATGGAPGPLAASKPQGGPQAGRWTAAGATGRAPGPLGAFLATGHLPPRATRCGGVHSRSASRQVVECTVAAPVATVAAPVAAECTVAAPVARGGAHSRSTRPATVWHAAP